MDQQLETIRTFKRKTCDSTQETMVTHHEHKVQTTLEQYGIKQTPIYNRNKNQITITNIKGGTPYEKRKLNNNNSITYNRNDHNHYSNDNNDNHLAIDEQDGDNNE